MGDVAIVLVPATGVLVILLTHAAARLYLWRVFRARQPPGTAAAAVAPTGQRHPDGTKSELRKKIETGLERLAPILLVLFPLGWVCLVMNVRGVAGWPPFGLIFSMFFLLLAIFAAVGADPSFRRQGRYEFAVNAFISKPIMAGFFAAASVSLALGSFFGAGPIGYPHNAICSASFGAFALSFALETAFDAVDLAVTRTPRRARGDLLEQQMSLQLEKPPPRCCLLWPGSPASYWYLEGADYFERPIDERLFARKRAELAFLGLLWATIFISLSAAMTIAGTPSWATWGGVFPMGLSVMVIPLAMSNFVNRRIRKALAGLGSVTIVTSHQEAAPNKPIQV